MTHCYMISYMSQTMFPKYRQMNFTTTQSSYKVYVTHGPSINIKRVLVYLKNEPDFSVFNPNIWLQTQPHIFSLGSRIKSINQN